MARPNKDKEREERIAMEIIVDAYGPEEQALGWYYYLEQHLQFPFTARCVARRSISPLKLGEQVKVVGMPSEVAQEQRIVRCPGIRQYKRHRQRKDLDLIISYAEAGATWWQESFAGSDAQELEAVRTRIRRGPPGSKGGREEFLDAIYVPRKCVDSVQTPRRWSLRLLHPLCGEGILTPV